VDEVVKLLKIEHLVRLRPGALSSGGQQRVALARVLVRRPAAFLMDEPPGALDVDFRETMRAEIKQLHLNQHATTVHVTHDQIEAMAMGDRIIVISAAEVQQVGTPAMVYHNPSGQRPRWSAPTGHWRRRFTPATGTVGSACCTWR
jgi:multiple sugar transport system ATP-binding protein